MDENKANTENSRSEVGMEGVGEETPEAASEPRDPPSKFTSTMVTADDTVKDGEHGDDSSVNRPTPGNAEDRGTSQTSKGSAEPFKMPMLAPRFALKKGSERVNMEEKKGKKQKPEGDKEPAVSVDGPSKSDDAEKTTPTPPVKAKLESISPAEQSQIVVPYNEPKWSGLCEEPYSFEVLKNGTIKDNVDLTTKQFHVFGRLPSCDVPMEHPSLSRHHAVVQYCKTADESHEVGWYLFDLDSTHGTWINKNKVKPRIYYRIRVGHVVKFGGSSRLHILQGPDEDQEEESELSITEMKTQREKQKKEAEILRQAELEDQQHKLEQLENAAEQAQGCSWGIGDDALEEEGDNPFAVSEAPTHEHLYIDDPKKALKNYFDREGYDLPDYQFSDGGGYGKHKCSVELPIDNINGEPIFAEVTVSGKRREAVVACALEACRILDKHGELNKKETESKKKKAKDWEADDFYDSDEDTFLDRTGDIERKRQQRMKKAGKVKEKAESYEVLSSKLEEIQKEIATVQVQLDHAKAEAARMQSDDIDALDAYMTSIKSGAVDTKTRMKLKRQMFDLKKEEQRLQRLVNVAKPANLPNIPKSSPDGLNKPLTGAALFGKIRAKAKLPVKPVVKGPSARVPPTEAGNDVEEEEEEEEEGRPKSIKDGESLSKKEKVANEMEIDPQLEDNNEKAESVSQRLHDSDRTMTSSTETTANVSENEHKKTNVSDSDTDNQSQIIEKNSEKKLANPERHKDVTSKPQNKEYKVELPPDFKMPQEAISKDTTQTDESTVEPPVPKKRKKPPKTKKPQPQEEESWGDYKMDDPDYSVWMPPKGQTGDGKTHLNAKFGY